MVSIIEVEDNPNVVGNENNCLLKCSLFENFYFEFLFKILNPLLKEKLTEKYYSDLSSIEFLKF